MFSGVIARSIFATEQSFRGLFRQRNKLAMMRCVSMVFLLSIGLFFTSQPVFAGAALMQAQRAKQMKARQAQAQQQAYMQAQQQAAAQQGSEVNTVEEQMAAQQMMRQQLERQIADYVQQQQINQVEQALAMRYLEEELHARMAQAQIQQMQQVNGQMMRQAVEASVSRAVEARLLAARDESAARAYVQARNEAIAMYGSQMKAQAEIAAYVASKQRPRKPAANEQVEQIVGVEQLWLKLDDKAQAWKLLMDDQAKTATVNEYIERFRRENIKITHPPSYYAQMIDDMSSQNPAMLKRPFKELIQILAIMEYDFDNGMDRDTLAHQVLGESMYQANKRRLGR